jgi:hypothetical protein
MPDKNPSLRDLYDALAPDTDALTHEEVAAELEGSEAEAAELRALIADRAQSLARDLRKNGIAAPPVLKDLVDTLDGTTALPREEKLAQARAASRITDLEQRKPVPRNFELLEAARKGRGELTSKDRELLDSEADDLRKEIDTEHGEEK